MESGRKIQDAHFLLKYIKPFYGIFAEHGVRVFLFEQHSARNEYSESDAEAIYQPKFEE